MAFPESSNKSGKGGPEVFPVLRKAPQAAVNVINRAILQTKCPNIYIFFQKAKNKCRYLKKKKKKSYLRLEQPEQINNGPNRNRRTSAISLWPVELLLEPFVLRFKYHFSGKRDTNRLDKVKTKKERGKENRETIDHQINLIQPLTSNP